MSELPIRRCDARQRPAGGRHGDVTVGPWHVRQDFLSAAWSVGECRPAAIHGLKKYGGGAVAVEERRDDAAVEVTIAIIVLRPRLEGRSDHAIAGVAA